MFFRAELAFFAVVWIFRLYNLKLCGTNKKDFLIRNFHPVKVFYGQGSRGKEFFFVPRMLL